MTRTDPAATGIIDALGSFYCYNITAALWADMVINRLEGLAIFLLGGELAEIADRARGVARRLADRIGDLGGAITADPRQLLDRSPAPGVHPPRLLRRRLDRHPRPAAAEHHHRRLRGIPG